MSPVTRPAPQRGHGSVAEEESARRLGTGIVLLALGAILTFAVRVEVSGTASS